MEVCWLYLLFWSVAVMNVQVDAENTVKSFQVKNAVARGAVCLDGTAPSYHYFEGYGDGYNNWVVYLEGGAWCTSKDDCVKRSKMYIGHGYDGQILFSGILDDDIKFNPDFYNWNKAYVHYCDGSSFMSNIEKVDPETKLTYRGARIYHIVMEELLALGLASSEKAILAGSSAGGLSTILHCDMFRSLIPKSSHVKCIADSGFFIHGKDLGGVELREKKYSDVITTHELANSLPTTCTSKMNPQLCMFPEYLVDDIKTPLFIIESAFDSYQVSENFLPAVVGGLNKSSNCTRDIKHCSDTQIELMKDFRRALIETLEKLDKCSSRGLFVHSCYRHMHINTRDGWTFSSTAGNVLATKSIGKAVSDWYFDRSGFYEIDTTMTKPWWCTNTLGI